MFTPTSANIPQYADGKQIDIAIGAGASATTSSAFYSLSEFNAPFDPKVITINDAEGNLTTNSDARPGNVEHPFSGKGVTDVNKFGLFAYYFFGLDTAIQDGSTGAYQHTFTMLNNVVKPRFTIFASIGAEGYRRLLNCSLSKLVFDVAESGEVNFTFEGYATGEDGVANVSGTLGSLVISGITYQSGSTASQGSIIRYAFSGSPTLTSVNVNDQLVVPSAATGITNAVNKGTFLVVAVDNVGKTIDVINNARYDSTADETSITSSAVSVNHVVTPSYAINVGILLHRNAAMYEATNTSGLGAATANGFRTLSLELNHNATYVWENPMSPDPLETLGHNITSTVTYTQIMSANSAARAIASRTQEANNKAYRFKLEDTSTNLGSSTTYHPLIQLTLPQAYGVGTRDNMGKPGELRYNWNLTVQEEQAITLIVRNTTASYP